MHRVNYPETLCGLIHDIGKVFLRYRMRFIEGLERERLSDIIDRIPDGADHEIAGIEVVKEATEKRVDPSVCVLFRGAIPFADVVAATERGLGYYQHLGGIWSSVEESVSLKTRVRYNHAHAPLLSPLWITHLTGYAESIGPCSKGSFSADVALPRLRGLIMDVIAGLETGDTERISSAISQLLVKLVNEQLWMSPRPLTVNEILNLKTRNYVEAQGDINYSEIVKWLLRGLRSVSRLYDGRVTRGHIDTLGELMRFTTITVPSAVYMALLPDTSLYSHSKLVAAYTAALSTGSDAFKLLVVDTRGIQNFVASPITPKAASRVIRGRSFLVELILMSLTNYILELYGGLPYVNVLTSEGGTVDIIVPALDDHHEETLRERIREVVRDTYERLRGLWFTFALSREFSREDVDFVRCLKECVYEGDRVRCPGFFELEEDLARRLATEKALDEARSALMIDERHIEGFDAITREPVMRRDLDDWYGLRVADDTRVYAAAISGDKLEAGDLVCESTHLSLVAGSALRNLILLLSIYAYEHVNDAPIPAAEGVTSVLDTLRDGISRQFKQEMHDKQLFFRNIEYKDYVFNVGLVPIPTLGAVHIMISARIPIHIQVVESDEAGRRGPLGGVRRELEETTAELASLILETTREVLRELAEKRHRVRVEIRWVNKGVEFIESLENKRLAEVSKDLLNSNIDIHIGTIHTGAYHPATEEGLVDLSAYNLIAMAKADADGLGEVRKLISFSPTRLASLSDFMTMVVNNKTSILAAEIAFEYARGLKPRGPILLYAGGDDVVFYGYWVDILLILKKLYEDVVSALFPLSFTSAVAIERSDYPLLELYTKIVKLLESGKEEARGWVYLADVSSAKPVVCTDSRVRLLSGLQPSTRGVYNTAPRAEIQTSLETYESLASLIERLERDTNEKSKVAEYKRELMILSRLASLERTELKALAEAMTGVKSMHDINVIYSLTRRLIALSYVSSRRKESLSRLAEILGNLLGVARDDVRLHHEPGEDIMKALRKIISSKTSIDTLILYLNPYSTEVITKSIG